MLPFWAKMVESQRFVCRLYKRETDFLLEFT
ncbi:hypothetical protein VCHENC02_0203A, partial [Vibrio harveyi]